MLKANTQEVNKSVARGDGVASTKQVFMIILATSVLLSDTALAAGAPWDNIVNTITGVFTGGLARAIAILVCIGLGIAAFFGKLSWKLAGGFIGGVVLIFGAAAIADFFIAGV